ncbi:hypothetical protein Taro_047354 [Colocasia esculenta]|uniref:Uncharacterized protein n=1 Tax=Colocasia esculenta TaxID=4460 RepID=A0A843X721_COLES|nr:hypothetical protein [Colocasia esculenta]
MARMCLNFGVEFEMIILTCSDSESSYCKRMAIDLQRDYPCHCTVGTLASLKDEYKFVGEPAWRQRGHPWDLKACLFDSPDCSISGEEHFRVEWVAAGQLRKHMGVALNEWAFPREGLYGPEHGSAKGHGAEVMENV